MIEITIVRRKEGVEQSSLKQFDSHRRAAKWLVEDSYFQNHDVVKVVWEQLGCRHDWQFLSVAERDIQGFNCRHCGVEFSMAPGLIDEMFRRAQ